MNFRLHISKHVLSLVTLYQCSETPEGLISVKQTSPNHKKVLLILVMIHVTLCLKRADKKYVKQSELIWMAGRIPLTRNAQRNNKKNTTTTSSSTTTTTSSSSNNNNNNKLKREP